MKTNHKHPGIPVIGFYFPLLAFFAVFALIPATINAQWNSNTSINIQISGMTVADMQSASTTDGKTWIAFYAQTGGNYDMRAQLIDANGYKLLGPDGILVDNHPSGSATYVFSVCVDASNNLIIAFQDERNGNDQAVVYKISESGSQLWGNDGIVLGLGLAPYPAVLSNGEVLIAWNESSSNTLKLQKITTGGVIAWTVPLTVMVGATRTTRGQAIAGTDGKFTLVCQKMGTGIYTTLYAQRFDNSGTSLYPPLQICNQTSSAARYYSIAAEGDTTYFGYYSSAGFRFNSYLQRINPDGTLPWGMNGSNFNTATGTNDSYQGETRINLIPGSKHVWSVCTFSNPNQTQYGVYIQKFLKTSGARQFTDAAKTVYPISGSSYTMAGELALIFGTPMFMSYTSNYKIYATRLDSIGNFIWPGNSIELSSTTATMANPKMRYGFTPVGPNKCAGTWTEKRSLNYLGYAQGVSIGGLIGVTVETQGGAPPSITTNGGTLPLVATVFPASADQSVTWSIVPGTGMASINSSGLVTAISNGTAYAIATAVQDTTVNDSLMITMSGQTATPPTVVTLEATGITFSTASLNGTVNANTLISDVSFEWGLSSLYGNTIAAIPPTVTGNSETPVSADIAGLASNTTYHFRVIASNAAGSSAGVDSTFTTSSGVGINEKDPSGIDLFPVPNDGRFKLSLHSEKEVSYELEVINSLGVSIYNGHSITVKGTTITDLDLGCVQGGFYTLILRNAGERIIRKLLIQK